MKRSVLSDLKYDLSSSIVVFLIAVPLCLGIALASGAPFFSGLIAGIVGGIVIGAVSNASLSVSGPAAGLTAIVLSGIHNLGAFDIFLLAVFLAGVMQLVLGFLKAGNIADYIPGTVIRGMLTAIGIIIIIKQLPFALGYHPAPEGEPLLKQVSGSGIGPALADFLQRIHIGVTVIALISLCMLLIWEKPFMQRIRLIPGALAVVVTAVLLNQFFKAFFPAMAIGKEDLVQLPVAGNVQEFLGLFTFPDFSAIRNPEVIGTAVTIAAVASIETLLCIEAVDKMDSLRRVTSQNRELKAQGIGNMVSGLLGGLPITSVIVRSSANINAGARTKASAIIHGLLILSCTALIPGILNMIPLGALAAILLLTGYKLAGISVFKEMFAKGKQQWVPFVVTVTAIVFTDLLTGVGAGLLTSMVVVLYVNLKNGYNLQQVHHPEGERVSIRLSEVVTFLNKAGIKSTLNRLPGNATVVIDAARSRYVDADVMNTIREFIKDTAPGRNIRCILTGFNDQYATDNTPHDQPSESRMYVSGNGSSVLHEADTLNANHR